MEIPGSIQAKFVETPSVKEVVLYANTPSFLIDRLRRDDATSYLAQMLTTEETINFLHRIEHPTDITELLWAYVLLASLFLRSDIAQFEGKLASLDLSQIQWGDDIRRSLLAEAIPTSINTIEYAEIRDASSPDAATVRVQVVFQPPQVLEVSQSVAGHLWLGSS